MSTLPSHATRYTERQGQYLAFIHAYTKVNGHPPAQATCSGSSQSPRRVFTRCCWAWNAGGSFAALRDSPAVSKCSLPQRTFRSCNNRPVPIGQNYCAEVLVSTVVTTDLRVVVPVRTCFGDDRTGSDSSHLLPLRGA